MTIKRRKTKKKAKRNWIQAAIFKRGALHKQLHIAADKTIPLKTLDEAIKKGGKLGKRARLAKTLRRLRKKRIER